VCKRRALPRLLAGGMLLPVAWSTDSKTSLRGNWPNN
jgi:hypothetical protein